MFPIAWFGLTEGERVRILKTPSSGGTLALFGKTDSGGAKEMEPSERPPSNGSRTVIGAGARIVGELSGDEDVVVDGRFEGKIRVERTVHVGSSGDLEADVSARTVIVGGKVRGQIVAAEKAELTSSAVVHGSVQAPKIVIAEGARLEGNVAMAAKPGAAPAPDSDSPAPR